MIKQFPPQQLCSTVRRGWRRKSYYPSKRIKGLWLRRNTRMTFP